MGNRSWLYLQSASGDDDATRTVEIAEANNNLPVLWQILLADGSDDEPISMQRVFGDAGTRNLSSEAPAALQRIRQLADFVVGHPLLHKQPHLSLQFEALLQHLARQIDLATHVGAAPPRFSANLDELSWLETTGEDAELDGFIERCRRTCNECWLALQACILAGNYPGLDAALKIESFDEWRDWAWQFGFGGLSHSYFSMQNTPRDVRYADFDEDAAANTGTFDYDNHIVDAFWRFQAEDQRWGICLDDGRSRRVLAEPEWDAIWNCHGPDRGLQWVSRADRIGLLLVEPNAARLVLAPQLEEAWDFEDGVATGRIGEKVGLLRADGTWLLPPSVDEIGSFSEGYACASVGGRVGFIDARGEWAITPRFDDALDFAPCGLAPALEGDRWGLVRSSGEWATQPAWDTIEWRHDWQAFECVLGEKSGLIDAEGHIAVEPLYAELECYDDGRPGEGIDRAQPAIVRLLAHDDTGQCGLIDARGRILVPFVYGRMSPFEPVSAGDQRFIEAPDYVRVANKGGSKAKNSPWLHGVYDIAAGRELIPCRHRHIHLLAWGTERGWLVGDPIPKAQQATQGEMRVGIARADGSMLHEQAYAWLAQAMLISESWFAVLIRADIYKHWSAGEAIQAVRNDSGVYVWLYADGREQAHLDYMAARHAAGDLNAAYDLARHYRMGEGIGSDDDEARRWMARAAGLPDGASIATPGLAHEQGLTSAMRELSLMLRDGEGGEADHVAERAWLEEAIKRGGGDEDPRTHSQLAYVLFHGIGGAQDLQRGLHHYEIAAEANNVIALFNLGLTYKEGRNLPADPERALGYLRRAEAAGHAGAGYYLGSLLRETAENMESQDKTGADERFSEAIYFLRKTAEQEDGDDDLASWACYELGLMYFNGQGGPEDIKQAETWLLRGAGDDSPVDPDSGRHVCIDLLTRRIYGDADSPLFDAGRAKAWAQRLA
jgi:TPR repeat protein